MTMSRKKVVKNLEDLDELTQFLLEKVREMIYSYKMNDFKELHSWKERMTP